ncbi:sensor histidine kinase KdpD [Clostridium sp. Ade.TY]|uniref:sensor histidine kinase n=1 Tax=Clostridium sp. Ade.TY TaxID=1391647 RepID=UPI00041B018F|nr:sensor histidine kinase KdpD [Clostridium sp. Ade.TY]
MSEIRPNPDELLKEINIENTNKKKGNLKIFFGYAAGVGKTFAMLEAAQEAKKLGIDVVVGYVEPHTRPETLELLKGLEIIPALKVYHRGITLKEFDLDRAIKRNPKLIIVDELAHTNAFGLRHKKRYRDIEELLDAGIDVYTTINVQHLESLNDIVASITHVVVNERVPDRIFNDANQVELIDIEPADLINRLESGKIYKKNQAKKALKNFFKRENLVALREIALRQTANRVNKEIYINKNNTEKYCVTERILVCLSSSPSNAKVIRTAARMSEAFHGELIALFVETINTEDLSDENIQRLRDNLKLAEEFGASVETVYGDDIPYQVAEFSKVSGISKVIVGRTKRKRILFGTKLGFVDKLIELAPNLDVYVIPDRNYDEHLSKKKYFKKIKLSSQDLLKTIAILLVSILISSIFNYVGFSEANTITVFILGVLIISSQTNGRIYGAVSSLLSVLLFNFFFTDPKFTFEAYDPGYIVTFFIMLVAAFITSTLTTRVKSQAKVSAVTAYRTSVLLDASIELERSEDLDDIILKSQMQLYKLLKKPVIIYKSKYEKIEKIYNYKFENGKELEKEYIGTSEQAVVSWVIKNKKRAGALTDTLPGARAIYIPLLRKENVMAVVGIVISDGEELDNLEKSLCTALLNQISFAIEKYILNEERKKTLMEAENERFRANLLRAVSHDLRTPLTSISGSASSILNNNFDEETKKRLITDIYDDSLWLINLVENLLSASRLDNGSVRLNKEPNLVEDIIEEAISHVNRKINEHNIEVEIKNDLLMVDVDIRLIIQVIINIVDNAIKYTERGSFIKIRSFVRNDKAIIEILDNGKGIKKQDRDHIFDMFYTANNKTGDSRRGLGLGLALCKSIVNAHDGEIYVKPNKPSGTIIGFSLNKVEVNKNENINFSC